MSFFAELKRRNVIRMAGLYLVAAWLIVQVAETLLPLYDTPDWVLKTMVMLLAAGFIPALIFSWVFELTPEGLKRESEVDRSQSTIDHTARKLDIAVIVLLLAIAGLILLRPIGTVDLIPSTDQVGASTEAPPSDQSGSNAPSAAPAAASTPSAASVAVLPFADLSAAGDQEYFSDGMAEEILNVLAKTRGLQVASRTSSFAFKGQEDLGIPAIAEQLSVRHVLEGSVRRAGDTLRITVQLIDAEVDRHLWSETFDRPLTAENVFAVQDEIASAVVAALVQSLQIEGVGDVKAVQLTENLSAYDLYLRARALTQTRHRMDEADRLLAEALEQDDQFAAAWALRAAVMPLLDEYTDTDVSADELDRLGIKYADRAIALDANSALALAVKANIRSLRAQTLRSSEVLSEVMADFEKAVTIDPQSTNALNWLGIARFHVGELDAAKQAFDRCVEIDPLFSACAENQYDVLYSLGRFDESYAVFLASLDRGAVTGQFANFPMLARNNERTAFILLSNQSAWLPRWRRHGEIFDAFRDTTGDHSALVADLTAFVEAEVPKHNRYLSLLLVPIGAHDMTPSVYALWSESHASYRQTPQFKRFIRDSGVYAYWQTEGYPPQCRAQGEDDFSCD